MSDKENKGNSSELVSTAIEASQTGLATNLFGPASKALGVYFGEKVEGWINRQRQSNTIDHINAVVEKAPDTSAEQEPSLRQAKQLIAWENAAQDYGSESPEISAIWRSLLEKIRSNDKRTDRDLKIATSLSAPSAELLFRIYNISSSGRRIQIGENEYLDELSRIGLTVRVSKAEQIFRSMRNPISLMAIFLLISFFVITPLEPLANMTPIGSHFSILRTVMFFSSLFLFIVSSVDILKKYSQEHNSVRITPSGKRTVEVAMKYMK